MGEDFSLGDDVTIGDSDSAAPFSPAVVKAQDEIVQSSMASIENAGKITEADKKKYQKKQVAPTAAPRTEEEEIAQMAMDLNDFIQDKVEINNDDGGIIDKLPTGIDVLDAIAGGGFGVGTFGQICGSPGTFKSALLAQIIAQSQKKYKGRLLTTYSDSEVAMSKERLAMMGVTRPQIEPYTDVTVENVFKTIEAVCAFKQLKGINEIPSIVAWDSIANTSTEKERTTDNLNDTIGLKARLLSGLFPRYLPKMKQNKITLLAVNQLREKLAMGMFAPPADLQHMGNKDIPGGQSVKFNAFHLLMLRNRGDLKFEQYGFNGIKLEAFFVKNKFFRPNIPVTLLVDFNTGISNFWTNYNFLVDNKKMQSGAWNLLLTIPEKKFRTKDALELYNTDEVFRNEFDKQVKETIQQVILSRGPVSSAATE